MAKIKGYKAFDKDLKCRDMQYEIGKEYTFKGKPIPCKQGFHFCKSIANCYNFYGKSEDTRICEIEALGNVVTDDEVKFCTDHIKILKEVKKPREKSNTSLSCSGYCNSGDCNSGNRNSGYCNSGDRNSSNWNSGDRNSGDFNSGNRNSGDLNRGDFNSGNWNSGYWNSGNWNSGDCNSGNFNSGDRNSGNWNSGNFNSGNFNSGDFNSGVFNTDKNPKIKMFDKDSDWTIDEWRNSIARNILWNCPHTYSKFINESYMSDEEKENHPEYKTIGGYVKTFIVTNADKQAWWDKLSDSDKQEIYSLPNFDKDKFKLCTGIEVDNGNVN